MKKKIAESFALWFFFLLCLCAMTFFGSSIAGLLCVIFWVLMPLLTWGVNLLVKNHISVTISMETTASKKETKMGYVTVENTSIFPVAKLYCSITLNNRLTGEKEKEILRMSAAPKGKTKKVFELSSAYCGYLQAEITGLYLMDWVGFLPVKCKKTAKAKIAVLPDTFTPHVFLRMSSVMREDADAWSQVYKGNDQTEVFSLREYVPGDSLKQIHWKLSSKKGQLIFREASLPIEKSLLIFWDKNTGETTPKEMDAMAECVTSVSQVILNQGYYFTLGWTDGRQILFEYIDSEELLLQTVPQMLKQGCNLSEGSGAFICAQDESRNSYGKVLYLAKTVPKDFVPFVCTDMTMVLCDRMTGQNDWKTVTFQADTYLEDLEILEL